MARIKTSQDLRIVASDAINRIMEGKMTPDEGNSVAKLGTLMLKIAVEEARIRPQQSGLDFFDDDEPITPSIPEKGQNIIDKKKLTLFEWEDFGKIQLGRWIVRGNTYRAELSVNGHGGYCYKVQLGMVNPENVSEGFSEKTIDDARAMAESSAQEHAKANGFA